MVSSCTLVLRASLRYADFVSPYYIFLLSFSFTFSKIKHSSLLPPTTYTTIYLHVGYPTFGDARHESVCSGSKAPRRLHFPPATATLLCFHARHLVALKAMAATSKTTVAATTAVAAVVIVATIMVHLMSSHQNADARQERLYCWHC